MAAHAHIPDERTFLNAEIGPVGARNERVRCLLQFRHKTVQFVYLVDFDGEVDEIDELDRFVTELQKTPNTLVPGADGTYLGIKEGPFIRYVRVGGHWEANAPDGTRFVFGISAAAREFDPE